MWQKFQSAGPGTEGKSRIRKNSRVSPGNARPGAEWEIGVVIILMVMRMETQTSDFGVFKRIQVGLMSERKVVFSRWLK